MGKKLTKEKIEEMRKNPSEIDWTGNLENYEIPEEILEEFSEVITEEDELNWDMIAVFQKVSEDFMRKHQEIFKFDWASKHQKMSEKFMEEYWSKLDLKDISKYQKMSERFIKKHLEELYLNEVLENTKVKISEKFRKKLTLAKNLGETQW